MSLQQSSSAAVYQPAPSNVLDKEAIRVEIDVHPQSTHVSENNTLDLLGNVKASRRETFVLTASAHTPSNPKIKGQVIQGAEALTFAEKENQPCDPVSLSVEVVEAKREGEAKTETDAKPSAWRRFVNGLAYNPLDEPEFIDAYHKWQLESRKERWDKRQAWIVAQGCKVGCLLGLVKKDKKEKAWAAYREKLDHLED